MFFKCFDTIYHILLTLKLKKYGIRNSEPLWFSDYLQNRTQAINLDRNISSFNNLTIGVPQGLVFGHLLFLISINGIDIDSKLNWNNYIDKLCKQFHPKSDYWGASTDPSNCMFN